MRKLLPRKLTRTMKVTTILEIPMVESESNVQYQPEPAKIVNEKPAKKKKAKKKVEEEKPVEAKCQGRA